MLITIFFILLMLVAIYYIARHPELTKPTKGFAIVILLIAIFLATIYEIGMQRMQQKVEDRKIAFQKGKIFICKDHNISNQTYLYESGTATLIPKRGVIGETYGILECTIAP